MLKTEKTEVYGWEAAIRGMRNPMNSWERSDSKWDTILDEERELTDRGEFIYQNIYRDTFVIGDDDLDLMKRLARGGAVHAKYRRMITVTVDITAPFYFWKEYDTYKIGTVANSCSTMHKIHERDLTLDDFSVEHLDTFGIAMMKQVIRLINTNRDFYLKSGKDKDFWWQMIQLLPTSYNQKRTVMLNYEVLVGMYRDRRNHKLDEWHTFCDWIETLPYSELITGDM